MRTLLVVCAVLLAGCVSRHPMPPPGQPDPELPEAVSLPYDPAYPRVVVVVESLAMQAAPQRRTDSPTRTGWGPWGWSLPGPVENAADSDALPDDAEATLAAALTVDLERALKSIGNVELVDPARYAAAREPRSLLPPGYAGPFVLSGSIAEFNEHIDTTNVATGTIMGTIGTAMAVAGAITGEPALAWAGVGVGALSPAFDYRVVRRTGAVRLDLGVYDARAGMIIDNLSPQGTSSDRSGLNGFALFGFGRPEPTYTLTLLGRAHRNAFNAVTNEVWAQLKRHL